MKASNCLPHSKLSLYSCSCSLYSCSCSSVWQLQLLISFNSFADVTSCTVMSHCCDVASLVCVCWCLSCTVILHLMIKSFTSIWLQLHQRLARGSCKKQSTTHFKNKGHTKETLHKPKTQLRLSWAATWMQNSRKLQHYTHVYMNARQQKTAALYVRVLFLLQPERDVGSEHGVAAAVTPVTRDHQQRSHLASPACVTETHLWKQVINILS